MRNKLLFTLIVIMNPMEKFTTKKNRNVIGVQLLDVWNAVTLVLVIDALISLSFQMENALRPFQLKVLR